ncbi:glycosyltransferase family 4 protein [Mesorhizobium sp. INR15]|uniref:glycosyltransferase family 4 protein n=1 Tax=Mesorhizobium sp. INR15 TaxID=2654248 RepID=UPI001896A01F|nr:glycosyltransferase family 4 protein [Mesorhizobium sp. INR15]QPC90588.1 glycosyltransferase [Mesorhizobium sp. INR15]
MKLLHIIPVLGAGGPTRSLLTFVKRTRSSHPGISHTIISLQAGDHMPLLFELRRLGAEILRAPGMEKTAAEISGADVVLVHFWNTPSLWRLLTADLPPARYVVWALILGANAPQKLNTRLATEAAGLVLTAPSSSDQANGLEAAPVVPGLADEHRLAGLHAKAHDGFNADYIGTTNRGKMHPRFIEMMAALDIPGLKVRICGGALEQGMASALAASPDPGRFECRGFVENIGAVLETSDVFAYPLAERTYASSDISLQEAMYAGVPPVILPHGGPSRFVVDGKNGIVAQSEGEFVAAIEHLHHHPEKRATLGHNARQSALALFSADRHVAALVETIEAASRQPKSGLLHDGHSAPMPASVLFLMSQDWDEATARNAVDTWSTGRTADLMAYAEGLDDDAFQVEGGVLHWRKAAMNDPLLRYWTAIWLARHDRIAEARHELSEALRLGAPASVAGHVIGPQA